MRRSTIGYVLLSMAVSSLPARHGTAVAQDAQTAPESATQPATAPSTQPQNADANRLLDAVRMNDVALVRSILKSDRSLANAKDESGLSALHWSVFGSVEIVNLLIEAGAKMDPRDDFQSTPLLRAKDPKIVEALLKGGANINAQDKAGMTAIHAAAVRGPTDVLRLLLSYNPDLSLKNSRGQTALDVATRAKNDAAVTYLKDKGAKSKDDDMVLSAKSLIQACASGDVEKARAAIRDFPKLTTVADDAGDTPLHIAAYKGQAAITKLLLENGAKVNVADNQGLTPLHLAAAADSPDVAKLLIARGANLKARDKQNRTPRDIAIAMNRQKVVEPLLDAEQRSEPPANQFAYALSRHKIDRMKALLKVYPELVRHRYESEVTPLHIAAALGDLDAINLLLDSGADINAPAINGQTPLSVAQNKGQAEAAKLLESRGGKVN